MLLALAACGDDGGKGGGDGGPQDGSTGDGLPGDAATDGMVGAPSDGLSPNLVVKNYLAWCSVSVNGGAASASAQQAVTVPAGTITLVATRASSTFEVSGDMWHHTDGDTGTGEPGTIANANDPATKSSTAMVTVAATAKCVWVCCPFVGGAGCGSTIPDQCP